MNHWLRTAFLASVLSCGSLWSTCVRAEQPPVLTPEQWREDLRYFARELPKRHKNLYHSVSPEEFQRSVAELDAAIPSLQAHEVVVRLHQIAASVGDGHTGVHTPPWFRLYPFSLYWFGPELRVIGAASDYARALGTRVVRIGDLDLAEVESRIRTCFPSAEHENEWYAMSTSPAFIARPEVLHALRVVADPSAPATFTLEDDSGSRFTLDVSPIATPAAVQGAVSLPGAVSAAKQQPLFRQKPGNPFWFTWLADTKTVYVSFRGYDSLRDKARALFRFIDDNPTRRVVIDVRQNGGGDFFEGRQHLIHPLKERPDINRKGRLYVIVGRRTYSAAMANAIDFRKDTNAILVGEPIGERPNSYSENDEMTLPSSGLVVSYSTRYYQFVDQDVPAVLPDVRIDPSWQDFQAGRDPSLDWILTQPIE